MLERFLLILLLIPNWYNYLCSQLDLPDELQPNITLAITNITNILASKITLNKTDDNDSISIDYFQDAEDSDNVTGHFDYNLLDPAAVGDLYKIAQEKNAMAERELNRTIGRNRQNRHQAYYPQTFFVTKAMDLMKQSIYATRYRLQDTRDLRKRFSGDLSYKAALLYGSLVQLRIKMENIYATMRKFKPNVRFIWYLVLYERCLTAHVDVTYGVQKAFDFHSQFLKQMHND